MDSEQIINKIAERSFSSGKADVEKISSCLADLGNPHLELKFIHVVGTNGKGSVCAILDSVLREAGYKVGLFTSPHLFDWHERIRLNGLKISDSDLIEHGQKIMDLDLGVFEKWFLMAMCFFAKERPDIVILEAGVGGRLDATNAIPSPEIAILTSVGLDHTEMLGETKEQITLEKSAITKDSILITGVEDPALLAFLPKNHIVSPKVDDFREKNKEIVKTACVILAEKGWKISHENIEKGIEKTYWPLRMELLKKEPLIIADGAHNLEGVSSAKKLFPKNTKGKTYMWIGMSKGKDHKEMLEILTKEIDFVIFSEASYKNASVESLQGLYKAGLAIPSIPQACKYLIENLKKEDSLIITGGLYFASEAVLALRESGFIDIQKFAQ